MKNSYIIFMGQKVDSNEKLEQKIKKTMDADMDSFEMISQLDKTKDRREAISQHIEKILGDFSTSPKTKEDFNEMMKRFELLHWSEKIDRNDLDRSWTQEQVDEFITTFEQAAKKIELGKESFLSAGNYFWYLLGTAEKSKRETNTISDLVASYFAKRIEEGEPLSPKLQEEIRGWAQNIQMADREPRLDMLVAILSNPGKVDRHTTHEVVANMGLYGPGLIEQLESSFNENRKDASKLLKIVEILNYLQGNWDQAGFEDSAEAAGQTLKKLSVANENYFVKTKINQLISLEPGGLTTKERRVILADKWKEIINSELFYYVFDESVDPKDIETVDPLNSDIISDEWIDFISRELNAVAPGIFSLEEKKSGRQQYEEDDPRRKYDIIPLSAQCEYNKGVLIQKACYSRISDNYAVIYTHDGRVDSFFELEQEEKEEGNKAKNLTIQQILEKEGFARERMKEADFKKLVLTYRSLLELPMREKIEKEFGMRLTDFSVREQVQFVNFLSTKSEKEVERVKEFLNQGTEKNNRIRAFLSLELDESFGESILAIGDHCTQKQADGIFKKYAQLAGLALKKEEELRSFSKDQKKLAGVDFNNIRNNLLLRAKNLLADFSKEISRKKTGQKGEDLIGEVMEKLESIPEDMILSAEIFNASLVSQAMGLPGQQEKETTVLEDLNNSDFEKTTAQELSQKTSSNQETLKQMRAIYRANYASRPSLRDALVKSLDNKIETNGDKTEVFIYRLHGKVSASCRFDDLGEGRFYFGSMNVHPEILKKSIGSAFMDRVLSSIAQRGTIEAECLPGENISSWYIREQGFVVDRIVDDYGKFGEDFIFHITREKNPPEYFFKKHAQEGGQGKQVMVSFQEVIKWFLENGPQEKDGKLVLQFKVKREISPDMYPQEMKDRLRELINEKGYVMTGYFFDKDNNAYCALERSGEKGAS